MKEYKLLWEEKFLPTADNSPNPNTWSFDLADGTAQGIPGWGNHEREYYVLEQASVGGGLTLTAVKANPDGAPVAYYGKAEWLSSKIHTAGKVTFKYGRFDFEAQAPTGGGSWPAIWMLGANIAEVQWPHCGEIDIFEGAGNRPYEIRGTLHGPEYCGNDGITGAIQMPQELSRGFHTYSIEWLPDSITWYVDNVEYFAIHRSQVENVGKVWPFDQEFYLIINLAMGGWFAGDVVNGFDSCNFTVASIAYSSIDGVGELHSYNPSKVRK